MEKRLLDINNNLTMSDLRDLKFLSFDIIPLQRLEKIKNPLDFFDTLKTKGFLNNFSLLEELFFLIGRIDLLKDHLNVSKEEVERKLQRSGGLVSSYRILLYNIAENMIQEQLTNLKFLLRNTFSRSTLESITSPLDLFIEMEKSGKMSQTDLVLLKKMLEEIEAKNLLELIKQYEKTRGTTSQPVCPPNVSEEKEMNTLQQSISPYKMQHVPHGYMVIINNHDFLSPFDVRRGSEKDVEALKSVFNWLQFEVKLHQNLDAKQLYNVMKQYSKMDHTSKDAFICCILSHGKKGVVFGIDRKPVIIKELVSYFIITECPSLKEKPKLFFIQACQGGETKGIELELDAEAIRNTHTHNWADMFIGMSTVEGFLALRDVYKGSPYIQHLCQEIRNHCPQKMGLLDIMTIVNQKVGNTIQMPELRSTLRSHFIFQVPDSKLPTPESQPYDSPLPCRLDLPELAAALSTEEVELAASGEPRPARSVCEQPSPSSPQGPSLKDRDL